MIEHSPDITKLAEALNLAQSEMRGVAKDASNPHFKNRYASLEAVIDGTKPALTKHGLAFTQAPGALIEGALEITTMLMHSSGQWIRSTLHMPVAKRDAQGVGSAITYGLRYSLMAVLGVPPTDDDDGERATDRNGPPDRAKSSAVTPLRSKDPIETLISAIESAQNDPFLSAITNSPANIRTFEAASEKDQTRINDAVRTKRESFTARAG